MKLHYILFLISTVILITTLYLWNKNKYNEPTVNEGFESLTNCLSQGYSSEFCRRVPLEACLYNCPKGTFKPKQFNTFLS